MRTLAMCVLVAMLAGAALAAPVAKIDYEDTGKLKSWRHKSNTAIEAVDEGTKDGGTAVRLTIEPQEFGFGWIQCTLPKGDYANAAGVHGYYRPAQGAYGKLNLYILLRKANEHPSYFASAVGPLSESQGEWVEFLLPIENFKYTRGDVKTLELGMLGDGRSMVEFHVSNLQKNGKNATVDVDGLEFVNGQDAAEIQKRLK